MHWLYNAIKPRFWKNVFKSFDCIVTPPCADRIWSFDLADRNVNIAHFGAECNTFSFISKKNIFRGSIFLYLRIFYQNFLDIFDVFIYIKYFCVILTLFLIKNKLRFFALLWCVFLAKMRRVFFVDNLTKNFIVILWAYFRCGFECIFKHCDERNFAHSHRSIFTRFPHEKARRSARLRVLFCVLALCVYLFAVKSINPSEKKKLSSWKASSRSL